MPGAMLATQLSALGAANRHVADAVLAQKLARIVPVLYGALAGLPAAELAAAAAVLEGQSTVWVGNGFVPAERVAFKVCGDRPCGAFLTCVAAFPRHCGSMADDRTGGKAHLVSPCLPDTQVLEFNASLERKHVQCGLW